jgi:ATP-dependent DNA helicase HFM1/MER3
MIYLLKDRYSVCGQQDCRYVSASSFCFIFLNAHISELAAYGIGVHHAGLALEDRRRIEDLYIKKVIRIVVATSTLAVGVNLRMLLNSPTPI